MSQVVEHHLPFVRHVAREVASRSPSPPDLDFDDLVQAGVVGLLEAVRRFDPNRGVAFRAFARKRVAGAMHDELRRSTRGAAPCVSLDDPGSAGGAAPLLDRIAAPELSAEPVSEELPTGERLSERRRVVLACVGAGYRLSEIGQMLGISPSRVRQLLDAARPRVVERARLSERELQVLAATAEGLTAKEVAHRLSIAPTTVQDHRRNAAAKLGARNTTHAVAVAYEEGVLPLLVGDRRRTRVR